MGRSIRLFLVLAPALLAQAPRTPRGIYAKVNITDTANQPQTGPCTNPDWDAYFNCLYQGLLANPVIAGLEIQVHWDTVNPNPPGAADSYFWNHVDDAFAQASSANKTVQLIVTPGFQSPPWLLEQIPPCDGLFQSPVQTPPSTCGTVTFNGFGPEEIDSPVFPLPWNPAYKSAWQTFLTALAARYGSNPAFVSIAITGPTAASPEMIVPNNNNTQTQESGFKPNDMWLQLFGFHYPNRAAYQNSDQAFIDEWDAAIDTFGQVFSGVTLVATTGSGFPNFNNDTYPIPPPFGKACGTANMDCAAKTTILAYLAEPSVGGANAKATQTSGLEVSREGHVNLGDMGVKVVSQSTEQFAAPSAQILGGVELNTSFSMNTLTEGCTMTFPPDAGDTPTACTNPDAPKELLSPACIPQACLVPGVTPATVAGYKNFSAVPAADLIPPEQALYNVLSAYFNGTPAASFFGGTPGPTPAPLNYLQFYFPDIQYAQANVAPAQVVEAGGVTVSTTAQGLLNLANQKLREMAEPPEFFIGEVSLGSGVYYLQFPNGTLFGYYNFPSFLIVYHYDLGFESFVDALDGNAGAYLYDFASSHWFYTSPSLFPYLYDFALNAWLYYFPNTKSAGHYTTNPRYFSNLTTSKIFTM